MIKLSDISPGATPTPTPSNESSKNANNGPTITVETDSNGNTIIKISGISIGEGDYGYITGLNELGPEKDSQIGTPGGAAIAKFSLLAAILSALNNKAVSVESTAQITIEVTPSGEVTAHLEVYTTTVDLRVNTELSGDVATKTSININIIDNSNGKSIASSEDAYCQGAEQKKPSLICERDSWAKGQLSENSTSWTVNVNVSLHSDIKPGNPGVISMGGWSGNMSLSISNNNGKINVAAPRKN